MKEAKVEANTRLASGPLAESNRARAAVFAEISRLGLQQNVLDLEQSGYTVMERLLDDSTVARARQAILNQIERKMGTRPDLDTFVGVTPLAHFLLFEDPVFEEILMNETMLALASYLLGQSLQLYSMTSLARGPENSHLNLHVDAPGPAPLQPHSVVANCNFALVDYTREAGCLAVVPGSHELCRQPFGAESDIYSNEHARPIEVPAGTAILYHGNAWHGAYRREIPGVRLNLAVAMCRNHIVTQEDIRGSITEEMLARNRNNQRFARTCGQELYYGYGVDGPDREKLGATVATVMGRFA